MQTGKGILIPSILKVGNGTLKKIGQYLKAENLEQVVIFFGNGLIDLFGMDVMDSLKQEGITVLEYSELDTVDIDDIITLAFAMQSITPLLAYAASALCATGAALLQPGLLKAAARQ